MSKCIVCECANILYYEPPKERPPLKCPNCGRDTRHYASMKTDDPRVNILLEKYRSRISESIPDVSENAADKENTDIHEADVKAESAKSESINTESAKTESTQEAHEMNDHKTESDLPDSGRGLEDRNSSSMSISSHLYMLRSVSGKYDIIIPADGGVIGRTALGGEELAHNGRISREHIKIVPAKRAQGVMIEDISANGTFVDGRRLSKNEQEFVVIGSEITMGGEAFILEKAACNS